MTNFIRTYAKNCQIPHPVMIILDIHHIVFPSPDSVQMSQRMNRRLNIQESIFQIILMSSYHES